MSSVIIFPKWNLILPMPSKNSVSHLSAVTKPMSNSGLGNNHDLITSTTCPQAILEINKVHEEICAWKPDRLDYIAPNHASGTNHKISEPDRLSEHVF